MQVLNFIAAAFVGDGLDGNLAGVCPLQEWLTDDEMQSIATFNNLPETAFVNLGADTLAIRWFTPSHEVRLCGHATLASVFVLHNRLGWTDRTFTFDAMGGQVLLAAVDGEFITLDFPAGAIAETNDRRGARALGLAPEQTLLGESWVCVLEDEAAVRAFKPNFDAIAALPEDGIIVTAPGDACDFVSRYFVPQAGIPEDPVTGYAHTLLVPYWAQRLGKNDLHAMQVSQAGGELFCRLQAGRVLMSGRARMVREAEVTVNASAIVSATA